MAGNKQEVGITDVEHIVIRQVRMRLRAPFATALGLEHSRDIIIVEVHADGVVGYGEVPVLSAPTYNEETAETAWHVLNDFFVPRLLADRGSARPLQTGTELSLETPRGVGEVDAVSPRRVAHRLAVFRGHPFAKAGLEGAVADATAKRAGVSLSVLLSQWSAAGKSPRRRVEAGVVVGMSGNESSDLSRFVEEVRTRLEQGYRRLKVKIRPGQDEGPLRAVRRAFGDIPLSVDANGTYRGIHPDAWGALDEWRLVYIEQPLAADDVSGHVQLQRHVETPICLDESIGRAAQARHALDVGACRVINIKASRLGGLTEAVAVHDMCVARHVPVLCGGLLESGIGRAHNVALASLPGFVLPGDLSASSRYWERDVVSPAFELDGDGCIPVPTEAGIGVHVDRDYLGRLTVRKQVHRPD